MKILIASSHGICDENYEDTQKSNTGFNNMIRVTSEMLAAKGDHVEIFTQANFTAGHPIGYSRLCHHTLFDVLTSFNFKYFKICLKINRHEGFTSREKVKNFLYFINGKYCQRLIRENNYDVVQIHGLTNATIPLFLACIYNDIPFAVTLHGLNSFDNNTQANQFTKELERKFIWFLMDHPNFKCSVVSSGIKKRMLDYTAKEGLDNVFVISNPVIRGESDDLKIDNAFINCILCVGNISKRKNQALVLEAYLSLPQYVRKKHSLLFIGGNEGGLKEKAAGRSENVFFLGPISHKKVMAYIKNAKMLITASVSEGFGLPIVEGYKYGIPSVFPDWIDAYADLYDSNCAVTVSRNTVDAFREAIITCVDKDWNKELIMHKAHQFSEDVVGNQYQLFLYETANKHESKMTYNDLLHILE